MLKKKCPLAFLRSCGQFRGLYSRCYRDNRISSNFSSREVKYEIELTTGGTWITLNQGWKATSRLFDVSKSLLVPCRHLVQYNKNAAISPDAFTKRNSSLNVGLNSNQNEQIGDHIISELSVRQRLRYYMRLSKIRLTGLVVLTTLAGYSLAPGEFSATTCVMASLGTMLCSSSANTINQWLEVPFDSQMSRTKNRVLVRGLMSSQHALLFGLTAGASGLAILSTQVNPLTAVLGASTLLLYTAVYTPLKRLSIANTWVGSLVGALPPLMGWSACTGSLHPGALILAGILYSWQFPHFNALSWNLRADYSRAGYRMMSVLNPELCRKVALRHCVSLVTLSTLLPVFDVTTWWLAVDSLPVNIWFAWLAWKFNNQSDNKSARELFRFSLLHLPILMALILFHKKSKKSETLDQ